MPRKIEYVSAVQAAAMTGLSEKTIRRKIERGELRAEKRGTSYAIRTRDLDKLAGQRPPTSDTLLSRIQELEEIQASQAAQIHTQAEQISALEHRIQELEQRPALPAPAVTRPLTGRIPHRPVTLTPIADDQADQDEGRTPTQPLAPPGDLPPGSVLAVHFARQYGINPRTFNDQIRALKVQATTVSKGGRPEHWLTPDQQEEIKRQRGL